MTYFVNTIRAASEPKNSNQALTLFEICYIKIPSYKNIVTQTIKVCKCLKYKKNEMETPYISKI